MFYLTDFALQVGLQNVSERERMVNKLPHLSSSWKLLMVSC